MLLQKKHHYDNHNTEPPPPLLMMKNITLHEKTKDDKYSTIITAHSCQVTSLSDTIDAEQITCTVFSNNQSLGWLHAYKTHINRARKYAQLIGAVNGKLKDLDFTSNDIIYCFTNNTITCPYTTTYTHPSFMIHAQKSIIDISNQTIRCTDGVQSEFFTQPDNQQQL